MTRAGFTLLEISIVLVIVGLVIGGIIVGRDMIEAATLRSQLSQIEQFNLATKTFQMKYNCLPGDCRNAASFAFTTRSGAAGRGDGNGKLFSSWPHPCMAFGGEQILFWRDLSDAKLIAETFNTATEAPVSTALGTDIALYMPRAKMGKDGYIGIANDGWRCTLYGVSSGDGSNSFVIGRVQGTIGWSGGETYNMPLFTPLQAYSIDSKIDDGLPQFGRAITYAGDGKSQWSAGGPGTSQGNGQYSSANGTKDSVTHGPVTSTTTPSRSTPASSTTCYDNGNVANATEQYSVGTNGGLNCHLMIQFQ